MIKHKAYKFRIYPTEEQQVLLSKTFGCVRFVYNHYLSMRKETYEADRHNISYSECSRDLVSFKKTNEFLKEVDSIALQQALRHLDTAFKNFFRDKKVGYPKFKSKKNHHNSYTTMYVNGNIHLEDGKLTLPKLKNIRIKQHRRIPENFVLKSVTVNQVPSGKYYASLSYEYEEEILPSTGGRSLGLDFSMSALFVADDDSVATDPEFLKRFRQSQEKLASAQRRLAHCQKGSRRYEKRRHRAALIHERTAFQRKDYLNKISRQIANAFDIVCVENLDMKAMAQSTEYAFGKSVGDNGWNTFLNMLSYKLEDQGKKLVKVDKWFASSQTCHVCGYRNHNLKLTDREWVCDKCGTWHDRDKNASINIKKEGLRILCA